ncbi:MAG: 50S ribosome-binding GTPase [Planctomycetes bacterium]|nr:50S ribosome-binding GTPase [Planctomycetota bacterium]
MPANLTPQYHKAEEEYKQAQTPQQKLESLKKMYALLPKHKGTEKLQADLKTKISRLKDEVEGEKKAAKKGVSHKIPHEGAGQVVIVGAPNVGKSQILARLTSAHPEVAPYPFTTHAPQPGMMPWNDVQVQLVDTPPITTDYLESYLPGMIRSADAALLVVDLSVDDGVEQADEVLSRLEDAKIRLVTRAALDSNNEVVVEKKTLIVANKIDAPDAPSRLEMLGELFADRFEIVPVSATGGTGMEELRDRLYRFLNVARVYTKAPGKPADKQRPFTCPVGSTVLDVARLVHKDLAEGLKFARIWGTGVYDGQSVGREHVVHDGDLIELHV